MRSFEPIAIIGQGCVLPGALSPEQLWSVVLEGRSTLGAAPAREWRVDPSTDRARLTKETLTDVGGYVRGFEDVFDPKGFDLGADITTNLDPVFLWTLHAAREALRSAGLRDGAKHPRGVVVLGNLSYPVPALADFAFEVWQGRTPTVDPRNRFMSGLPAALTAKALGLGLGGFALDAACASSLYAIALACERLHDGTADLALAGGVNHADALFLHLGFTALAAQSPTGQSRPFHRAADGLVPAHGAAIVALQRLSDAVASNAPILGVIRGVGLSNDGRGRGLLVPQQSGQARAMRAAYAMSGLSPRDISLVECHATGTPVGDATEVRSLIDVFEGARDLPIGSLKSNLGHLITASGAAALIKVTSAMRARVRPPTLHVEQPIDELTNAPLRLLREAEAWPSDGPRRAAISNFGFGGNNAHLVVEEWAGASSSTSASPTRARVPIAVVAQHVMSGACADTEAFEARLFDRAPAPISNVSARATDFAIDIARTRFPPTDLQAALPQQMLLLRAALELEDVISKLPIERTGLLVGMQCDAEVARCSLRWRMANAAAGDVTEGPLTAALVVGCMPNIVANRLGSLFGFEQPTFTISAEEASGTIALEHAMRSLSLGEIDAAIVGAVDAGAEPVHEAATAQVLDAARHVAADAAVLMVLKRLDDAVAAGDRVLAVLGDEADASHIDALKLGPKNAGLSSRFGHAHAASGLLHVAAAVASTQHRALPLGLDGAPLPLLMNHGARRLAVEVEALGGTRTTTTIEAASRVRHADTTRLALFAANDREGLLRALDRDERSAAGGMRVAIVADGDAELAARTKRARELLASSKEPSATLDDGIYFGEGAIAGELAFVFTGPAGAYQGMGRELSLTLPELVDGLGARMLGLRDAAGWIYEEKLGYRATPSQKLWGSSYLIQLHAELTRGLLGMRPEASIGYCSGETNALFALGAWRDLDGFRKAIDEHDVYTRELCGELACVRRAWNASDSEQVGWTSLRVRAEVAAVRAALENEPRAHLTIINAPTDVVIAGDPDACARVTAKLGAHRARWLDYDFVMHCPEARPYASMWRTLHHRPTAPVPGVRFYTHATLSSYAVTADAAADALTGQAMNVVNFPALVERAYADGVRVFVEHGPHGGCTKWIDEVLGDRPHLAVALDRYGRSSMLEAADAIARLAAAGVPMDLAPLFDRLAPAKPEPKVERATTNKPRAMRTFPAHLEPVRMRANDAVQALEAVEVMAPAPTLPIAQATFVREEVEDVIAAPVVSEEPVLMKSDPVVEASPLIAQVGEVHRAYLRHAASTHAAFLEAFAATSSAAPMMLQQAAPQLAPPMPMPMPISIAAPPIAIAPAPIAAPPIAIAAASAKAPAPVVVAKKDTRPKARTPVGPAFSRQQLEVLASGKISSVFGPLFEKQDGYRRQVRMPEPPLLLADRVLGIDGAPGEMGTGVIWTETDVTEDAWYVHQGRMPAGILVESGQADLLLISWLGVDFLNKGERVYRLLGCELTAHGELPRVGDTLHYEIHVDGHASQGDVRLFFFHYDCWVNGELRVTVRNGQAGFFTNEELAGSAGVLWSADEAKPTPIDRARLSPPVARCTKSRLTAEDLDALVAGDGLTCFGPGFERLAAHTLTPSIQGGNMRLVDEVLALDLDGGPWKRGYLKARLALRPDHWFFNGHFKDDPCMPGTLMFEGCFQALAIYLAALGFTLDRDGGRFEPVSDALYHLRCRGQALPSSTEVVYEVFIDEIVDGPEPMVFADLLGTVDGLKAFHCRRMGLRLVPGWPMDRGRLPVAIPEKASGPVAKPYDLELGYRSLVACALGRPTEAFGEMYAKFDSARRVARLPGPPYHFMSRIARIDGERESMIAGARVEVAYDVPRDAWYFNEGPRRVMPFAVLLEVALQPCGWLASYVGSASTADRDLLFRNLDGTGTVHREVTDTTGTLITTSKLTSLSKAGGLILLGFEVTVSASDGPVYSLSTVFGFFPPETMKNQAGLPAPAALVAKLAEPSDVAVDLCAPSTERERFFNTALRLPDAQLLMIDGLSGLWPRGGKAGLGRVRAYKHVEPREWFFKAHFFQDPVQPGSLGLEAMLQALQAFVISEGLGAELPGAAFEPIANDVAMTWKYRGQVVPESKRVEIDLEITSIERTDRACTVIASGSLWADGKRLYEATGLGARVVATDNPPDDDKPKTAAFDRDEARAFWRGVTGAREGWAGEDLFFSLIDQFVADVRFADAEAIAARRGKGAIYVANHQVALETILAAIVIGGVSRTVPTLPAKAEHRDTWVGALTTLLTSRPGLTDPRLLRFIDRSDPASVLSLREDLLSELHQGRSALVHVEGTRATSCRSRVATMSSVFLDLAIGAGVDVIPVRFVGGLPIEDQGRRFELPVACGKQTYWFGKPIAAATLAELPYAARPVHVLNAINALGVAPEHETPATANRELERDVRALRDELHVPEAQAAMIASLERLASPSTETRLLLDALRGRASITSLDLWLARVATWLLGN
jgi:acyl transferase domain-containing protein/3-hydroxymyristoyl/3-hydroxydecanoyl-(acyl carrier protein) dehydratase